MKPGPKPTYRAAVNSSANPAISRLLDHGDKGRCFLEALIVGIR